MTRRQKTQTYAIREVSNQEAGPILKLVEALSASDPQKLATFRQEHEALISEYFDDNAVHQGFLMTRAIRR